MSQVAQTFESKARISTLAGLIIEFGEMAVEGNAIKMPTVWVYREEVNGAVPLFTVITPANVGGAYNAAINKYNNLGEVVRHLHRQVYMNAYEDCVTTYTFDREEVMRMLITAAGLIGVNVWTTLNNPNECVNGTFTHNGELVKFSRGLENGNFVTNFETVSYTETVNGTHELTFEGEVLDTSGLPKQPGVFIGSSSIINKSTVVVPGSMYNPSIQKEFRDASIGGGLMILPQEMYAEHITALEVTSSGTDGESKVRLITSKHEVTAEMVESLKQFNEMTPKGEHGDTGHRGCGCAADCDNHAADETYALEGNGCAPKPDDVK